jgi:hypothetical protein
MGVTWNTGSKPRLSGRSNKTCWNMWPKMSGVAGCAPDVVRKTAWVHTYSIKFALGYSLDTSCLLQAHSERSTPNRKGSLCEYVTRRIAI